MKKVGILGSGVVGKTLALGFHKHGYSVMLGTQHPDKLEEWKANAGKDIQVADFQSTAKFADIIVLSVKGSASMEVLDMAGKHNLDGKIVIDTTNPIDHNQAPVNGVLGFYTTLQQSLMELLQAANPNAHFVKAFNSIGSQSMVNPKFAGGTPSMFICGNDEAAKKEVSKILVKFGFEVEDMGAVEGARAIEPLCILWCIPGMLHNSWSHAFKLLRP